MNYPLTHEKQPQIPEALDYLDKAIEQLRQSLDGLSEHLSPIRSPLPPAVAESVGQELLGPCAPLTNRINHITGVVRELLTAIEQLNRSLEI